MPSLSNWRTNDEDETATDLIDPVLTPHMTVKQTLVARCRAPAVIVTKGLLKSWTIDAMMGKTLSYLGRQIWYQIIVDDVPQGFKMLLIPVNKSQLFAHKLKKQSCDWISLNCAPPTSLKLLFLYA
jgi:hypothetical protein